MLRRQRETCPWEIQPSGPGLAGCGIIRLSSDRVNLPAVASCLHIHPENPQARLVDQAVDMANRGGLLVCPTDTCYALMCRIDARSAQERLRLIRQLDVQHDLSLIFSSLSQLSDYAKLDDRSFRLVRRLLPGPYTLVLPATRDVPRRLSSPQKRSIGVRIPGDPICQALLARLGEPLMGSTLQLPGMEFPLVDPDDICERTGNRVDLVLLGRPGRRECSTILDFCVWPPKVLRRGAGALKPLEDTGILL